MESAKERARGVHLALLVLCLGAWAAVLSSVLAHLAPDLLGPAARILTWCPYRAITGEPCPFCGTAAAAALLLEGEVSASLAANPLAAALAPLGIAQTAYRLWRAARPRLSIGEEVLVAAPGGLAAIAILSVV